MSSQSDFRSPGPRRSEAERWAAVRGKGDALRGSEEDSSDQKSDGVRGVDLLEDLGIRSPALSREVRYER